MDTKIIGGTLLIAGTAIGGGMLSLPIVTVHGGLYNSSILFVCCWVLMTFTAFLTLEANLWFPDKSNIVSMAKATLGTTGSIICWTIYLLFLYSLIAAYISGGQDVLSGLLSTIKFHMPSWLISIIFTIILSSIVLSKARAVDIINRVLMAIKIFVFLAITSIALKHLHLPEIHHTDPTLTFPSIAVIITSFGFSIIIPTLRSYFEDNIRQMRIAILVGSLIPLLCYLIWEITIFGSLPIEGKFGLKALSELTFPVTGLMKSMDYSYNQPYVKYFFKIFTSICVCTSFLCVALSTYDFVADGLYKTNIINIEKLHSFLVPAIVFLPPLLLVVFYPKIFLCALNYAGLLCIILQVLMPTCIVWRGRYVKKYNMIYKVSGGKLTLLFTMIISIALIILMKLQ